jgi:ubiquinone/menaquinone biosynthesis C-methylase UbiE/uncharacterized membrane protein YbhN (UPF0104 family)
VRFVRWHWLLRRFALRLPTIDSLGSYIGSFAFLPVPLYLGQIVARWRLLRDAPSGDRPGILVASVIERVADLWAVSVLAALALPRGRALALFVLAVVPLVPGLRRAAIGLLERAVQQVVDTVSDPADGRVVVLLPRETEPAHFATLAVTSLGAWSATTLSLVALAWAAGIDASWLALQGAAATSILLGGLSLVPLGASVGGIVLARALEGLGGASAAVVQTVFVYRFATAWLTLALGALALWLVLRRRGQPHVHDHFDAIDECYDAWLPEHYRTHLITRKTVPMIARLGGLGVAPRGLDIGCGRGWYLGELRTAGAEMIGLDMSGRQLAAAAAHTQGAVPFVQGTVMHLPFEDASFDFAYIINVLHHVPSPQHQREALAEIARVVRPGGLVFVHEMSIRNPLFRLYLSYVFPLVKGIEEGTEYYLDPDRMRDLPGLRPEAVHYFTFVPDFVPPALLPPLAAIERRLEASRFAPWAAHFLAVFVREP